MAEFDTVNSATFKMTDGVRDTFVGDKDKGVFEPTIQISPWEDEEDCLKVYKDISASISKQTNLTDKANLIWQDSKEIWTIQPFGNYKPTGIKDDYYNWLGAQCLIRIDSKPIIVGDYARFEFKLENYENMKFLLQPGEGHPEWKPEWKSGTSDWFEWSIAVYHKIKHNSSPGHNYKTSKICHILRPWCEDDLGNFTWGKWEIGNDTITKLIPKEAFEQGSWWIIDATFGNTAQGGGAANHIVDRVRATAEGHSPASDGTVDNLHAWLSASGVTDRNIAMALYNNANQAFIAGSGSDLVNSGTDLDGDITFPYAGGGPSVLSAVSYDIAVWSEGAAGYVYIYDDFSSGAGYRTDDTDTFNWADPEGTTAANRIHSLYVEYSVGVGGNAPTGAIHGALYGPMGGVA